MKAKTILLGAIVGLWATANAWGQTSITGTVRGDFGEPIPGVEVVARLVRGNAPVSEVDQTTDTGGFTLKVKVSPSEPILLEFLPPAGTDFAPGFLRLLSSEGPPSVDLQNINKILSRGGTDEPVHRKSSAPQSAEPESIDQAPKEGPGKVQPEAATPPIEATDQAVNIAMNDQLAKLRDFEDVYYRYLTSPEMSQFDRKMLNYIKRYVGRMGNVLQAVPEDACGRPLAQGNSQVRSAYLEKRREVAQLLGVTMLEDRREPECTSPCVPRCPGQSLRPRFFHRWAR